MQATEDDIIQLGLEFPDVPDVGTAVVLADGDNATCYLAGDSGLVLRVPKSDAITARTPGELMLLDYLAGALASVDGPSLPVVHHRSSRSMAHAYPYIPGTVLSRAWLQETPIPVQVELANSLAAFLSRLHALQVPAQVAALLPQYDTFDATHLMVDLVADSHLAYLIDDVRSAAAVCSWYDRNDERVLLHNDFAHGNLVMEKECSAAGQRYSLSGVIDWNNAYIGPAYRELRQLALVAPHFARLIAHPKRVPGIAAASFLRGVRLALCEPDSARRQFELTRALREHRAFNRYTICRDDAGDGLPLYAGAAGLTQDLASAFAYDRASLAQDALLRMAPQELAPLGATPRVSPPMVPFDELPAAWHAQYPAMEGGLRC